MVKILESPANYIYYNEIITLLKELKVYGKYKNQLRLSAYKAMQKNNENDTETNSFWFTHTYADVSTNMLY